MRMTRQRRIILEELRNTRTHPSADEVYERVRRRLPRISLGTVYRNLDVLSQSGVILRMDGAGQQRRFDATTDPHYHIRCTGCGRVDDLFFECEQDLEQCARESCDYEVTGHWVQFDGLCPKCRNRGPSK